MTVIARFPRLKGMDFGEGEVELLVSWLYGVVEALISQFPSLHHHPRRSLKSREAAGLKVRWCDCEKRNCYLHPGYSHLFYLLGYTLNAIPIAVFLFLNTAQPAQYSPNAVLVLL